MHYVFYGGLITLRGKRSKRRSRKQLEEPELAWRI
jgi:hypothetical protein